MPTAFEAIRGVANACQALPNLVIGGQPTRQHLEALKGAGAKLILDVRAPGEPRGFDEAATLAALGLEYVNIPMGPGVPLTDQLMETILGILRQHAGDSTFYHCASGNRVGGALIPYLILDHAMEEEDAIMIAQRGGLRARELLDWGVDYARRHPR